MLRTWPLNCIRPGGLPPIVAVTTTSKSLQFARLFEHPLRRRPRRRLSLHTTTSRFAILSGASVRTLGLTSTHSIADFRGLIGWCGVLDSLEQEIQRARGFIEGLKDDWDGNGAIAVAKPTWQRAELWLRTFALPYTEADPAPTISPYGNGSVDIFWNYPQVQLLVNIPPPDQKSFFSGSLRTGLTLQGSFMPETHSLRGLRQLLQFDLLKSRICPSTGSFLGADEVE